MKIVKQSDPLDAMQVWSVRLAYFGILMMMGSAFFAILAIWALG